MAKDEPIGGDWQDFERSPTREVFWGHGRRPGDPPVERKVDVDALVGARRYPGRAVIDGNPVRDSWARLRADAEMNVSVQPLIKWEVGDDAPPEPTPISSGPQWWWYCFANGIVAHGPGVVLGAAIGWLIAEVATWVLRWPS